jgi:glycosyltransferase involved in cell wall biosynthesis
MACKVRVASRINGSGTRGNGWRALSRALRKHGQAVGERMVQEPVTTVIVPTLNGAAYIDAALISVLKQTTESDQIIVIDNGSVDETATILQRYERRITILKEDKPGAAAARNAGLRIAKGDFIAFLDHDDQWPDGRHADFLSCLHRSGANSVVGRLRILVEPGTDGRAYDSWDGQIEPKILGTCLFRRSLVEAAGLFDETIRGHGEDNDFYLRLVEAGMKLQICDVDALYYRRHSSNITNHAHSRVEIMLDLVRRKMDRRRSLEQKPM